MQLEMTQVFLHDGWHRHAQRSGKIVDGHGPLFFRIGEKLNQAASQIASISGLVKLNCDILAIGHLAKVRQIGAYDGNAIRAGQMSNATASCRRRIRHRGDRGALKNVGQTVFVQITRKFDPVIAFPFVLHRLHIAGGLRMISSRNHQSRVRHNCNDQVKRLNEQLEPFIRSPFPEGQDAMLGISTPGEIRIFRPGGQNAMRADVNVIPAVLVVKNLAVSRHQHGDGI